MTTLHLGLADITPVLRLLVQGHIPASYEPTVDCIYLDELIIVMDLSLFVLIHFLCFTFQFGDTNKLNI